MSHVSALRLGIVQTASGPDPEANMVRLIPACAELAGACDLVVLPEYALCLADFPTITQHALTMADAVDFGAQLAAAAAAPVVLGGVAVSVDKHIFNRAIVVDAVGSVLAAYDKIHLFQLHSEAATDPTTTNPTVDESQCFTAGTTPVAFRLGAWSIGLSICYDLRFPELYRCLAPVDLFLCPAAFTAATGTAHWQVLLQARAIENQCFVAGVGICGSNEQTGLQLHGHSMVIGPWGEPLWQAAAAPAVATVELAHSQLTAVRRRLPALAGRCLGLQVNNGRVCDQTAPNSA